MVYPPSFPQSEHLEYSFFDIACVNVIYEKGNISSNSIR